MTQTQLPFRGSDYCPEFDYARLAGQIRRVYDAMKDGHWRTLREISEITHDGEASISAQLRNLKKRDFGGHVIEKQARGERSRGLFEYRLVL